MWQIALINFNTFLVFTQVGHDELPFTLLSNILPKIFVWTFVKFIGFGIFFYFAVLGKFCFKVLISLIKYLEEILLFFLILNLRVCIWFLITFMQMSDRIHQWIQLCWKFSIWKDCWLLIDSDFSSFRFPSSPFRTFTN